LIFTLSFVIAKIISLVQRYKKNEYEGTKTQKNVYLCTQKVRNDVYA